VLTLLILLPGVACRRDAARPPQTAQTAQAPGATAVPGLPPGLAMPPPPEETRPVYPPRLEGAPEPLAVALCEALHAVPERHRLACCGGASGLVLTGECVRVLTCSLRSGAITLDAAAVSACAAAQEAAHAGCDWIGPWPPELPPSCRSALRGTLAAGARCRSSLECAGSRHCRGVGPTALGTCGPPRPDGERCALAVDPLASYTRQDRTEREHPECSGFCSSRHLCEPVRPLGAECVMSSQCGPDARCGRGRCMKGALAQAGEACSGDECPAGLRCYQHTCQAPRPTGSACRSDFECSGGCRKPAGAAVGQCAPRCGLGG
jgi:hypothetical protein